MSETYDLNWRKFFQFKVGVKDVYLECYYDSSYSQGRKEHYDLRRSYTTNRGPK
jgi:hypothetical protein